MQSIIQEHLEKHATGGAHGTHYVYWVPVKVFNTLPITPWKFNRPPDMDRVAEIHAFMKESKRADGFIYLACINHQLVCYESNHRRMALKNDMPDDMAQVLVDVLWDATDEVVKQEFFRLNKAVSVPELYVDNSAEESVTKVLDVINTFCNKYPKLKSTSARPNRPGYNRDTFTNDFVRVMKELNIGAEELMSRLERLNAEMSTRSRKKLSATCGQKCEASGLWLFAWSPVLNAKELE